jgi:hypothetical protein
LILVPSLIRLGWPFKVATQIDSTADGNQPLVRILAWDVGMWKGRRLQAALKSFESDLIAASQPGAWSELDESDRIGRDVPAFVPLARMAAVLPWLLVIVGVIASALWWRDAIVVDFWAIWLSSLLADVIPRWALGFHTAAGTGRMLLTTGALCAALSVVWFLP